MVKDDESGIIVSSLGEAEPIESASANKKSEDATHSVVGAADQKTESHVSPSKPEDSEQQKTTSNPVDQKHTEELENASQLLENAIKAYGPWDMRVASAFCSLGKIYTHTGLLPEALAMFEKDLQITRRNVNDGDLRVAGAKYNVGMTACKVGRYPQALANLEDALRVRTAILGPHHPDVADVLTCIGGVYSCTGRHVEALAKYEAATAIRRTAIGPYDATVALSLQNSAAAHGCLGQIDQVYATLPDCLFRARLTSISFSEEADTPTSIPMRALRQAQQPLRPPRRDPSSGPIRVSMRAHTHARALRALAAGGGGVRGGARNPAAAPGARARDDKARAEAARGSGQGRPVGQGGVWGREGGWRGD